MNEIKKITNYNQLVSMVTNKHQWRSARLVYYGEDETTIALNNAYLDKTVAIIVFNDKEQVVRHIYIIDNSFQLDVELKEIFKNFIDPYTLIFYSFLQ